MAESLLAHLYTRIKGSQEDVATMALHFIISSSPMLNEAFNVLMSDSLRVKIEPDIVYSCQPVGENSERPDMAGVDKDGKEVILCEMKFFAGLTSNQPNGYLDRLIKEKGKALVFVCPAERKISLWSKVKDLCIERGRILSDEDGFSVTADGIRMALVTWDEIICVLRRAASAGAYTAMSDIDQLEGFCKKMVQDAFIPFSSDELGPETPRREDRYYQVVDAVIDKLSSMKSIETSIKGVRATPFWFGYSRSIKVNRIWCVIAYDRSSWKKSQAESPFWIAIRDLEWKQPTSFDVLFNSIPNKEKSTLDGYVSIALHPLVNVPLDDIVDDMVKQILGFVSVLESVK